MTAPLSPNRGAARRPASAPIAAGFDELLTGSLDVAYRAALHLCRNAADAEDLVQEAALLACRHRAGFESGTNFRAWFLRILTNAFYSRCRKAVTVRESVSFDGMEEVRVFRYALEHGLAGHSDPARAFLDRLDAEAVSQALCGLPADYRVVTTMYLVDDLTYREIADILQVPIGTVRSRLHRGRAMLKRALWSLATDRGLATLQH